jgi:hypothetical protein
MSYFYSLAELSWDLLHVQKLLAASLIMCKKCVVGVEIYSDSLISFLYGNISPSPNPPNETTNEDEHVTSYRKHASMSNFRKA